MNPLFLRSLLFDQAGDGTGSGGGAGAPPASGGDPASNGAPPALTHDAVQKLVNDSINGFSKRFTGEIGTRFTKFEEMLSGFRQQASPPLNPPASNAPPANESEEAKALRLRSERDMENLRREVAEAKKQSAETEKARQATEENARKMAADAKLSTALSGIEFLEGMGQDAFNLIRPALRYNDEGQIVAGDAQLPVDAFVKDWLKGRSNFLRPQNVGGTGGSVRGGGSTAGGGKPVDIDEISSTMAPERRAEAYRQALALATRR